MSLLINKIQDNKNFYFEKYQKYKDRKKNLKNIDESDVLEAIDDYSDILKRSNKPVSRLCGKTIKSYKKMFKDGNI